MKFSSLMVIPAFLLSFLYIGANAQPLNADGLEIGMDHRRVLLEAHGFEAPARRGATLTFFVSKDEAGFDSNYALAIDPVDENERPVVSINGGTFSVPIQHNNYALFQIPGSYLKPGETNSLSILSESGSAYAIDDAVLFSLDGSYEEVHFHRAFSTADRRALPPLHSSQSNYDVTSYTLELDVTMNSSRFLVGKLTMEAVSLVDNLSQVALDFDWEDTISSVNLVPAVGGTTYSYDSSNDWLIVNIPSGSRPDTNDSFIIEVQYSGDPPPSAGAFGLGSYDVTTHHGIPVAWTFSEPYSARSWWPCKDIPSDKAIVDLLITVPDAYEVVSNGRLASTTSDGGGKTTYHWDHDYPVSTYLVAFCATDYDSVTGTYTAKDNVTTMPVVLNVLPASNSELSAIDNTIRILDHFADLFVEYPFLTDKYATMTWGGGFGMEHQTCTSLPEGELDNSNGESRRNVHELSHMWFGDMVTPTNFNHLWLNEGWATYCEALYREFDNGTGDYHSAVNFWMFSSSINNSTPLVNSNADNFASSLVYRKGALVLHMLRHVVGDSAFFTGTRNYLNDNAYGIIDTDDFQAAIEAAHGSSLDDFFTDWVYETGRPDYQYWWKTSGNTLTVNIEQIQSGDEFELPIDIEVEYANGSTQTFVADMVDKTQSFNFDITGMTVARVDFDPDNWIYKLNATQLTGPPEPVLLSVIGDFGAAEATWQSGGGTTAGFRVFASNNRETWTLVADENDLGSAATTQSVDFYQETDGIPTGVYVAVQAVDSEGRLSEWSDIYGAVELPVSGTRGATQNDLVLIVDGYDRWNSQGRGTNHPFAAVHGESVGYAYLNYNTVANELVGSSVDLLDYEAVVWVLGEESTADRSFDDSEQALVQSYLEAGGKLFVSGAEIGWDVGRPASGNYSPTFYNDYLKANYVSDDWNGSYLVTLSSEASFINYLPSSLEFDDGSGGIYYPRYPDVISPTTGAVKVYEYDASNTAAIYYNGTFGSGETPGYLFYLGFPFETIISQTERNNLMVAVMYSFGVASNSAVENWWIMK